MSTKFRLMAMMAAAALLAACVPVAIGAGTAVVADQVIEEEQGGDGLF